MRPITQNKNLLHQVQYWNIFWINFFAWNFEAKRDIPKMIFWRKNSHFCSWPMVSFLLFSQPSDIFHSTPFCTEEVWDCPEFYWRLCGRFLVWCHKLSSPRTGLITLPVRIAGPTLVLSMIHSGWRESGEMANIWWSWQGPWDSRG